MGAEQRWHKIPCAGTGARPGTRPGARHEPRSDEQERAQAARIKRSCSRRSYPGDCASTAPPAHGRTASAWRQPRAADHRQASRPRRDRTDGRSPPRYVSGLPPAPEHGLARLSGEAWPVTPGVFSCRPREGRSGGEGFWTSLGRPGFSTSEGRGKPRHAACDGAGRVRTWCSPT